MAQNREIVAQVNALSVLANKVLPTASADTRVAYRLRVLKPIAVDAEGTRKKIVARVMKELETIEDPRLRDSTNAAMLVEIEDFFDAEADETPIFKSKLTDADLPKALKGDEGEKNREGLAAIQADLGILFELKDID